jgi:multicomponent K+:H+ antiporter subunit E
MARAFNWLLPHPFLTLILAIVWMLLQNEVSAGMAVFGIILGIIIPWGTSIWWPDTPKGFRLSKMITYSFMVPNAKLKPAWIVIPLELREPEAITVLAGTITLTPGTVSADLSDQGHSLLVHVLHTDDPDAVRDEITSRYQRRLLEIFT